MRLSLLFCSILVASSLNSCGTPGTPVDVPDVTLYFQKGNPALPDSFPEYILQEQFLTSGSTNMDKADWDLISQGKVAMSLSDWDKINIFVSNVCNQVECDYQALQRIQQLTAEFHAALP